MIREAKAADGTEMMISNAVFTNRTNVASDYAAEALRSFNAPVLNASSATPINNWVKKRTNNLIEEVRRSEILVVCPNAAVSADDSAHLILMKTLVCIFYCISH
jgi:hypothetical protein